MTQTPLALIGGTGPQGRGLAMQLARTGLDVAVGSRDAARAVDVAAELTRRAGVERPIRGMANGDAAAGAGYVLLTVPFAHAAATLEGVRDRLQAGAVFVDVTVPLSFAGGRVRYAPPPQGSGSRLLREALPARVPLLGCFKTLPAHLLESLETPLDADTFVFGDSREARGEWMEVVRRVPGLRPVDVGGLSAAATVEGMTALLVGINRRYRSREGRFRVLGVEA